MPDGLEKLKRYPLQRLIERAEKDTRQFTKTPIVELEGTHLILPCLNAQPNTGQAQE